MHNSTMIANHSLLTAVGTGQRAAPSSCGVALLIMAIALTADDSPGQILTENAGVTSPEVPTLQLQLSAFEFDDLFDFRATPQLVLGLNRKTELKVSTPVVLHRWARFSAAPGAQDRETWWGPGDVTVRLKRSLAQTDGVMTSTRFAALFEASLPTGRDNVRGGGIRLPRKLQISTGGLRFGAGLAASWIRDRHRFSVDSWFRHPLRHDGIRIGESITAGAAYWFRLHPVVFDPDEEAVEIRPVIELRYTHQFASVADRRLADDGDRWIIAPGLQVYPTPNLLFEASVQLPIAQTIDDPRGDLRWGGLITIKVLF